MTGDGDPEAGMPLFEDLSDDYQSPGKSTKRKRNTDIEIASKKSAKRRKSKKPADVNDDVLDAELGVNRAIAYMDSSLMADHIAQRTRRFRPELSLVETEDFHIPEKAIVDTTSWSRPRTSHELSAFLEQFAGPRRGSSKKGRKLSDAPHDKGHPHTIVIAGAGLRAADLTRALRRFQTKEALVAKLFAKHIKLNEAIEMAKQSRINIGVGTPQRIVDLMDKGALSSSHLERIVVDASHIDQKKRGILDMKETQVPLIQLLTRPELKNRYSDATSKVELIFF